MRFQKVGERYIAEREADCRNWVALAGQAAPERNETVVTSAAEERARVFHICVKDFKNHSGVIIKAARDARINDGIADSALLQLRDELSQSPRINQREGVFF